MKLICVQEQHLPGITPEVKWEPATEWGYTGIALRAKGDLPFEAGCRSCAAPAVTVL